MAKRPRLKDQAYETVKRRLLDGEYEAGQWLSVENLVVELGASRQPIMDALKRLATEGFLEIRPQVGVRVIVPERQDVADFFRLFAAVEGLCAQLAAERSDAAGAAQLAEINAEFGRLNGHSDDKTLAVVYRPLNHAFHEQVRNLAGSATLAAFAASLWDRADFYTATTIGTGSFVRRLPSAHLEHELVYRAIAAKDPQAARQAMESHVLGFEPQTLDRIAAHGN